MSTPTRERGDADPGPGEPGVRRVGGGPPLPTWLVLASMTAVVLAALGFFITGSPDRSVRADVAPATAAPTPSATLPSETPAGPGATRQDRGGAEGGRGDGRKQGQGKGNQGKGDGKPGRSPVALVRIASVDVYNNTAVTGLAAQNASRLRALGWTVTSEANWTGVIPQTTVYYPAALVDQAELLADDLGVNRVRPAVSPMSFERLTLILAGTG